MNSHIFSSFLVAVAVNALWVAYVPAAVTSFEEEEEEEEDGLSEREDETMSTLLVSEREDEISTVLRICCDMDSTSSYFFIL